MEYAHKSPAMAGDLDLADFFAISCSQHPQGAGFVAQSFALESARAGSRRVQMLVPAGYLKTIMPHLATISLHFMSEHMIFTSGI